MSTNTIGENSVVLRLEFSIADAVHQRGLFPVILAACKAWWVRPCGPGEVPDHLRADIGLPPAPKPVDLLFLSPYFIRPDKDRWRSR